MADNPLANEPRGNQKVILILLAAGAFFVIIFVVFFSGIFSDTVTNRANSNTPTNQNRAVP